MLLEKTGSNSGSICKLEITQVENIDTDALTFNGEVVQDVTLLEGKEWEDIYFTQDTAHFVERHNGEHYELKVNWRSPKDSKASLAYLNKLKRNRYLARITDLNDVVVLAGSKEEPCSISHSLRDKGQNGRDSNHYNLELSLSRAEPAAIVSE